MQVVFLLRQSRASFVSNRLHIVNQACHYRLVTQLELVRLALSQTKTFQTKWQRAGLIYREKAAWGSRSELVPPLELLKLRYLSTQINTTTFHIIPSFKRWDILRFDVSPTLENSFTNQRLTIFCIILCVQFWFVMPRAVVINARDRTTLRWCVAVGTSVSTTHSKACLETSYPTLAMTCPSQLKTNSLFWSSSKAQLHVCLSRRDTNVRCSTPKYTAVGTSIFRNL